MWWLICTIIMFFFLVCVVGWGAMALGAQCGLSFCSAYGWPVEQYHDNSLYVETVPPEHNASTLSREYEFQWFSKLKDTSQGGVANTCEPWIVNLKDWGAEDRGTTGDCFNVDICLDMMANQWRNGGINWMCNEWHDFIILYVVLLAIKCGFCGCLCGSSGVGWLVCSHLAQVRGGRGGLWPSGLDVVTLFAQHIARTWGQWHPTQRHDSSS